AHLQKRPKRERDTHTHTHTYIHTHIHLQTRTQKHLDTHTHNHLLTNTRTHKHTRTILPSLYKSPVPSPLRSSLLFLREQIVQTIITKCIRWTMRVKQQAICETGIIW